MKNENANISSYFCHTNMCIPTYSTTAGDELQLYKQTVYLVHNYSLRSKDPRDSVVVLIENSTFFPFFKFDFRHEYDEILNIFSFD